jgi:hypothetical protein
MNNWMPRTLGSMMLRPGTAYLGASASNNKAKYIPFVFADDDTALVEVTNQLVRVWVSDALVTRAAVTSAITNGTFGSDVTTGWSTPAGQTAAAWHASGYLGLEGDGTNAEGIYQTVTTVETGTEHALTIVVVRGPVTLKVGSTQGADDYIAETALGEGTHSLTLTPSGNFTIQFENTRSYQALVDSVAIESAGVMTIPAPWLTADLGRLRYDQSGDIIYVAAAKTTDKIGYQPYKIERRSTTSWSVVKYIPEDGPFRSINTGPITIASSVTKGDATLTASADLFQTTSVGSLYKLASNGQQVTQDNIDASAADVFTDPIKVFGAANARIFTFTIADYGATTHLITIQRTFTGPDGTYADLPAGYTNNANAVETYDDGLDNTEAWYRIGIKNADWGAGGAVVDVKLDYAAGSVAGKALITGYSTATTVTAVILDNLGSIDATSDWYEGAWSDRRGWPTATRITEGRLGMFGRSKAWLTVSDDYESYDTEVEGDSGPITRTVGSGPVDHVNWAIAVRTLLFGTDSREHTLRSSSQNEVLTPTNAAIRNFSSQGSADSVGLELDDTALFVQKGGKRLMQSVYDSRLEYVTGDLSILYPESGGTGIDHIAIQRQPDTRIHCLRSDGTVAILLYDTSEEVSCWLTVSAADPSREQYTHNSKTADLSSADAILLRMILDPADGTQGFVLGDTNNSLYGITLSTGWDISTASLTGASFDLTPINTSLADIAVADNGRSGFVLIGSSGSEAIRKVTFSTPYGVSAVTYETPLTTYLIANALGASSVSAIQVNNAGTRLYVLYLLGGINYVQVFSFGTALDHTTLTVSAELPLNVDSQAVTTTDGGLWVSDDESRIYVVDAAGDALHLYIVKTPGTLSTAQYTGWNEALTAVGSFAGAVTFKPDYSSFYINQTSVDTVYQYDENASTTAIEDIVVLPGSAGSGEEAVYYSVKRTINGSVVRWLEKWSLESECLGGTLSKNIDSHVVGTVAADGTMSGLTHLEGEPVVVWVNGVDAGTYTVSSGAISAVTTTGSAVVGLSYTAQYKSTKLGLLMSKKNLTRLGIIAENMHYQALTYGKDFSSLDALPMTQDGGTIADDTVHTKFDEETFSFDGVWDTDSRLCLQGESPRPVTLLAAVLEFDG